MPTLSLSKNQGSRAGTRDIYHIGRARAQSGKRLGAAIVKIDSQWLLFGNRCLGASADLTIVKL